MILLNKYIFDDINTGDKMKKIKENYIFYTIIQIILIIFPLVTFPYVSKTLGVENYGLYSYSYAIVTYFITFARLGLITYGTREIAENSNSKDKVSNTFSEIYQVQFFLDLFVLFIYIIYCSIIKENLIYNLLYSLFLIVEMSDICWFYQGIQNFKKTSLRNLFINLILLPCIFLFIKDKNDLNTYIIIAFISQIGGNILTWINLKQKININVFKEKINYKKIKKHLKGMLVLFIPILASSIYNLIDETMLGLLSVYSEVGLYVCAKKIIWIPLSLITPLSMILLPYTSEKISNEKKLNNNIKEKGLLFSIWITSACACGLLYIAPNIFNLLFSNEYQGAILITQIMTIYLFFNVISIYLRDVYFLPKHKESVFIKTVFIGIPINIILNILLIPKLHGIGASITTILTELITCIIRIIIIRKEINWKNIIYNTIYFIMSSIIMLIIVNIISINVSYQIINILLNITISIVIYLILTGKKIFNIVKKN